MNTLDISDWDKEVGATDAAVSLADMDKLVADYVKARDEYDAKNKELKSLGEFCDAAEGKVLAALKAVGKTKYVVEGIGTFSIVSKEQVTVPKTLDDKLSLYEWILSNYGADVLENMRSINSRTLNSFYNEEAEKNKMNPTFRIPGLATPTVFEQVRFKRG